MQNLVERVKQSSIGKSNDDIQNAISEGVKILTKRIDLTDDTTRSAIISADDPLTELASMISPLTEGSTSERTKRAEAAEALMLLLRHTPKEGAPAARPAGADAEKAAGRQAGMCRSVLEQRLALAREAERDRSIRTILERALK
jgi:hypothetical protein